MTTIAYNHKTRTIAVDSRRTGDNIIQSDTDVKYRHYKDGSVWFLCGKVIHLDALIEAYDGKVFKESDYFEVNAFYVKDGDVYRCGIEEGLFWQELTEDSRAMGTGWKWAMAAMDFGKDAPEAVEYAKTRDYYTGGKVYIFSIEENCFVEDVVEK